MSDDEFALSSGDEAALVAATTAASTTSTKHTLPELHECNLPAKRAKVANLTASPPSPSTLLARKILKEPFQLDAFRLEQEAAVTRLLDGGSAVVVFPTGGGKSLCYQVSRFIQTAHGRLTTTGSRRGLEVSRSTTRSPVQGTERTHTCHFTSHRTDEGSS